LREAEDSYTKSIELCKIQELKKQDNIDNGMFGSKSCDNLYVLYLNRGTTRLALNTTTAKVRQEALDDLEEAAKLRGQPDALIFQNRARGRELNGLYTLADSDYDLAISMSKDGVAPYWLRAALVKFELNRYTEALSIIRRVEQRFPEAPEVRATLAALYSAMGDADSAQRKFLEIPVPTRLQYSDPSYLTQTIVWPPKPLYHITQLAKAVGDAK
jgi:tetratricopeptide (TPR) repeat protein